MTGVSVWLFDLDGTLLDTLDDLHSAVNFALKKHGLPLRSREEVKNFIGNGIALLMKRSVGLERLATVDFQAIMADFKEYYGAHCQDKTRPYEGVLDLLAELKRQGKAVGVVSNKADFAVKKLCAAYFGELVDVAIGENEAAGIAKKPAPDTIFAALDKLGIAVGNAVYVGDSEVDIQTAAAAKIPCISVAWGMKSEQFLRENGAKNIVFSVEDLQKMI